MKILHTSDWHLGKTLEGYSRLEEQEKFLEELVEIAEREKIDLVLLAGDVYDSANPPAPAEKLFYDTLKRLSKNGERAILVIAGNHDSPERLMAAGPLAYDHGVILLGKPKSSVLPGKYGRFEVEEAGEGYLKLKIRGERAVVLTLPYPSEKRLNEILSLESDEEVCRKSYSERVGEFFRSLSRHFSEDTVNLAVSHLYVAGGEESESERDIQLGGSFAVDPEMLPDAHYIALGHLHRPQRAKGGKRAYYSGSPLQYSKSEIDYSKCVYILEAEPGKEPLIREVLLKSHRPIEVWKCSSIEEAIQKCRDNQDGERWVYLEVKTDRSLTQAEIKEMKSLRPGIVRITPLYQGEKEEEQEIRDHTKFKIDELFRAFYRNKKGVDAPDDIMNMFYEIAMEEGIDDETRQIED